MKEDMTNDWKFMLYHLIDKAKANILTFTVVQENQIS
jgi:hypothetical protein